MQAVATPKNIVSAEMVKTAIMEKMDTDAFNVWIAPANINIVQNHISVIAPNQFSADFIKSVHMGTIQLVANDFDMTFTIGTATAASKSAPMANDNLQCVFTPAPVPVAMPIAFDNFIASDENAFVLSACKKIAAGSASFSPLFIYGPSGSGKTLLAGCINTSAKGRTVMMTGGTFVSEFLRAMREHSVFAFKDFCRKCDTFILDDVQVLAGKRATMDEFLQLILDLRGANKNIVLISNAAPANLTGFDRRVQSLFASGLVADVSAPNKTVIRTILTRAGVARDVATMLSGRIDADGHLIAGISTKIKTYSELMGTSVDVKIAEKLLTDTLQKNKTPTSMVKSMCLKMGVSYDAICARGRSRTIVRSRQIMMVALKSATTLSLAEIGRECGDRDHATVLYAIAQIAAARNSDLILSAEIDQMINECR